MHLLYTFEYDYMIVVTKESHLRVIWIIQKHLDMLVVLFAGIYTDIKWFSAVFWQ